MPGAAVRQRAFALAATLVLAASAMSTESEMDTSSRRAVSPQDYSTALTYSMFFYEVQKAGSRASSVSGIDVSWKGDTVMEMDGALAGGFFDAGDSVQYSLPEGFSLTMLAWGVLEFPGGYTRSGNMRAIVGHLKHGCDFILSAWDPSAKTLVALLGDPNLDHSYWMPPEMIDEIRMPRPVFRLSPSKPGSEVAGEFAATLAASAMVFEKYGSALGGAMNSAYISKIKKAAVEILAFGEQYKGNYAKSVPLVEDFYNSFSGYEDELAWGCAWLAKATGGPAYKARAFQYYKQSLPSPGWGINWDSKAYGNSFLMYDLFPPGSPEHELGRQKIGADLDFWMNSVPKLEGTLAILTEWGSNRYAANEAFLSMLWFKRSKVAKYREWAKSQIDFMLGDNSNGFSYVIGIGSRYPKNPHHRAAHGSFGDSMAVPSETRHVLYGALVGGHMNTSGIAYNDDRNDYQSNEVACDYNAGLSGALAGLVETFKGGRGAAVPREMPGKEIEVSASQSRTPTSTTVDVNLVQMTGWPPRKVGLSVRYYISIGEVSESDLKVSILGGVRSPSAAATVKRDASGSYAEINWGQANAPFPARQSDNRAAVKFEISLRSGGPWRGRGKDPSDGDNSKIVVMSGNSVLHGSGSGGGPNPPPATQPPKPPAPRTPAPRPPTPTSAPSSPPRPPPETPAPTPQAPKTPAPKPSSTPVPVPTNGPTGSDALEWSVPALWGGGMVVEARVVGGVAGTTVSFDWDVPVDIVNMWSANQVVSEPKRLVCRLIHSAEWGFQASFAGSTAPKPLNIRVEGTKSSDRVAPAMAVRTPPPLPPPATPPPPIPQSGGPCGDISYDSSNSWGDGFVAKVSLGRQGSAAGSIFKLKFASDVKVDYVWGIDLLSFDNGVLEGKTQYADADIGIEARGSEKANWITVNDVTCNL